MINYVYQLVSPQVFSIKYEDIGLENDVIVKPKYMAVCHADQRYYLGQRETTTLHKKLPMALIHECCGEVAVDKTGAFSPGQLVSLIPNVPALASSMIYENYQKGSRFLSSGYDGFMREFVSIPADRLVGFQNIPLPVACIAEFVSVAIHASNRFSLLAHSKRDTIGVWGDGSLAYVVSCVLRKKFPKAKIVVIGKNATKLSHFSFVSKTYLADVLPDDFEVDHAFECAGGEGSYYAIEDIIKYIAPQGTAMLMGVTENKVAINTRNLLEKGLTFVGTSRSGRKDFEEAIRYMEEPSFWHRLKVIVYEESPVCSVDDIHRVFSVDLHTPFKTVFEWRL